MGVRRVAAVAVMGVTAMVLGGCSVPTSFGARLNSDDTVDYVICNGEGTRVEVDYLYDGESPWAEDAPEAEWIAKGSRRVGLDVVRYGDPPEGFVTMVYAEPPANWDWVSFGGESMGRDDLVEGEWVWMYTSDYPWVPEHPCDGVDLDDLTS